MICPPPLPFISWAVRSNQYIPMTIQCQFSRFPFGKWCCITFSCHIWTKAVQMSISQSVKVPLNGSATIWCLNSSSQSCISCKIPEGHSAPSSGSFIKVLNSIDPSTNHKGAPLVTVKMHFVLLMTSPLSLGCSQFSVHPTASLSHPEFTGLPVRKLKCQKLWSQDKQDIRQLTPHLWCIPSGLTDCVGLACLSVPTLIRDLPRVKPLLLQTSWFQRPGIPEGKSYH